MVTSIVYIMGVAGSGKSTIAKKLSAETGVPFFDADDFHGTGSIEKMRKGIPLTDEDREPWLHKLSIILQNQEDKE